MVFSFSFPLDSSVARFICTDLFHLLLCFATTSSSTTSGSSFPSIVSSVRTPTIAISFSLITFLWNTTITSFSPSASCSVSFFSFSPSASYPPSFFSVYVCSFCPSFFSVFSFSPSASCPSSAFSVCTLSPSSSYVSISVASSLPFPSFYVIVPSFSLSISSSPSSPFESTSSSLSTSSLSTSSPSSSSSLFFLSLSLLISGLKSQYAHANHYFHLGSTLEVEDPSLFA